MEGLRQEFWHMVRLRIVLVLSIIQELYLLVFQGLQINGIKLEFNMQ